MLAKEDFAPMAEFLGVSGSQLREQFLETVELFGKEHFRPKILRKEGKPYGQCIFFSGDGKCKVHPAKPLQCRVAMGCKPYGEELMLWFQENYLVDWKDKQSIREFEGYVGAGGKALPNKKIEKKKERISPKRS
ncbi:hypothetical protein HYU13_05315 [Candidatus Woesearchaeota archaeon]|nr:hypothetical protein [Candidatus Woesearchaeota archaeon]